MKQKPIDLFLFILGFLLIIGSLASWIDLGVISVSATRTWWGYVTIVAGIVVILYAATRLWPGFLDVQIARHTKTAAVIGLVASLGVVAYVGIKLTDASRQFNDESNSISSETTPSGLGSEFDDSMEELSDSIANMFKPTLGTGWYISGVSSLVALGLVLRKNVKDEATTEEVQS
jgi:hypothetical protein